MQSSLFQLLITKTIMLTLLDLHSGLICQNCISVLGDGRGGRNGAFAFHEYRKKKKRYKIHLCFTASSSQAPSQRTDQLTLLVTLKPCCSANAGSQSLHAMKMEYERLQIVSVFVLPALGKESSRTAEYSQPF